MEICTYLCSALGLGMLIAVVITLRHQCQFNDEMRDKIYKLENEIPNRFISFNGNEAGKLYKKEETK